MTAVQRRPHDSVPVLQILTRLNIGGPARHVGLLSRLLPRHGFDCSVAAGESGPGEGFMPPPQLPLAYIPTLRRPIRLIDDIKAGRALERLVRRMQPTIVHTHMSKAGVLGRMAARRAGVPLILHTFHGHVLEGYFPGAASRAFLQAERILARQSDALVAVSPAIRNELLGLGVGRSDQWYVVPLGLDLDEFRDRPDPSVARRTLGLDPSQQHVGIVGRIAPVKNHQMFLDVAGEVLSRKGGVSFIVAGGGPLLGQLVQRGRRISENIKFLGWIRDLRSLYAAMDVLVLTSEKEGTPTALIEAAAAGRPVVATDVGGVRDVVEDRLTGYLVGSRHVTAMVTRILALLRSRELSSAMGARARVRAFAEFSGERMGKELAALYRELLARRLGGAPTTG